MFNKFSFISKYSVYCTFSNVSISLFVSKIKWTKLLSDMSCKKKNFAPTLKFHLFPLEVDCGVFL